MHRTTGKGSMCTTNIALLVKSLISSDIDLLTTLHVEHVPRLPGGLWDGSSHFVNFIFVGFLVSIYSAIRLLLSHKDTIFVKVLC
jgi:hypothetical protein